MEERKGVMTPKQEELVAKALDYWFKFKNPIIEKFDYQLFLLIVRGADNIGMDKIPNQWKNKLIPLIDAAMDGYVESVRLSVTDLLNEKIDLPKIDDYQELIVFDQFTKFVATVVEYYALNKAT